MKDATRQPTTLERLEQLIDPEREGDGPFGGWGDIDQHDILDWLTWTHSFLSARKLYHKKAAVKTALLKKMAETLLSKDELEQVDREAERQLEPIDDMKEHFEEMDRLDQQEKELKS